MHVCPENPKGLDPGDVVCVGLVGRGRLVDWSPGGYEPEPVEWVPEATFEHILNLAAHRGLPVLRKLDIYAQTRLGPADCRRILEKWIEIEEALKGTPGEGAAAAVARLMQACAGSDGDVELLIEGP